MRTGKPGTLKAKYGHFVAESDNLQHLDLSMFLIVKKEVEILDP